MNIEKKRHKLLEILTKQRNDVDLGKSESNAYGIMFSDIFRELECDEDQLKLITSELFSSDEIGYFNANSIVGLFVKSNGKTAFSNKKYLKRIIEQRKEIVKFLVQTTIPILALVIAIITLSLKFNSLKIQSKEELQKLESIIKEQGQRINKLEKYPSKNQIENKKKDSLNFRKK